MIVNRKYHYTDAFKISQYIAKMIILSGRIFCLKINRYNIISLFTVVDTIPRPWSEEECRAFESGTVSLYTNEVMFVPYVLGYW